MMASRTLLPLLMFLTRAVRGTGFPALAAERLPELGVLGQLRLGLGMVAATAAPGFLGGGRVKRAGATAPGGAGRAAGTLGSGKVAGILTGCVQEGLLARVNRATVRVLEANGFRVVEVPSQGCCGAIHAHSGDLDGARALARENIRAFEEVGVEVVAVNAAGCGAIMKEYGHLLAGDSAFAERAAALASQVRDVSELLGVPGLRTGGSLPLAVTYDAPCHLLHAQKVAAEPLRLLSSIPGLQLLPLANHEECCGGAGIYGITHPELGGRIGLDKVRAIVDTGAEVVATGNPGCLMQIGAGLRMAGLRVEVAHPVELLDESYRRGGLYGR
jgi:glycolate oxidase iron-sulfur subunit